MIVQDSMDYRMVGVLKDTLYPWNIEEREGMFSYTTDSILPHGLAAREIILPGNPVQRPA